MNKELIKKYKAEFDHWLCGGKLLGRFNFTNIKNYKPEPWFEFEETKWSIVSFEFLDIIINDEYVELRKALVEGKTIQFKQNRDVDFTDLENDLEFYIKEYPHLSISRYRIKPEEPLFKKDDYVVKEGICRIHGPYREIYKVTSLMERSPGLYNVSVKNPKTRSHRVFFGEELKPWKQINGEYCIMKQDDYNRGFTVQVWNESEHPKWVPLPYFGNVPGVDE